MGARVNGTCMSDQEDCTVCFGQEVTDWSGLQ